MDTATVTTPPDAATQPDATIDKDPEPGRHRQRAEKMMVDEEAKALLERDCTDDYFHLRYYRGSFWFWQDGVYREVPTDDIKGQVVTELNQRYENVKRSHVDDVVMQLRGQGQLPGSIEPPAWIGDAKHPDWDPREVLATKNKLIHLPSLFTGSDYSVAPTPAFFNQAALDFDFIEGAECPPPGRWQSFLNELVATSDARYRRLCILCKLKQRRLQAWVVVTKRRALG